MSLEDKYDLQASKLIGDTATFKELKAKRAYHDLSIFSEAKAKEAMWIEFETREVEITEGVHKCKCGGKKVYVVSSQTRGGDEAMSFFAKCIKPECGRIWTI